MPAGAIYVGRPSRWSNPWLIVPVNDPHFAFSDAADVRHVVEGLILGRFARFTRTPRTGAPYWATRQFESDLLTGRLPDPWLIRDLHELAGRDLACWCPLDQPCHADVWLKLALANCGAQ